MSHSCEARVAGAQGGFCREKGRPGSRYCDIHDDAPALRVLDADLVIVVRRFADGEAWQSEVLIHGEGHGGGTAPTVEGAIDVAMDVLFGDTNDHLNGWFGSVKQLTDE